MEFLFFKDRFPNHDIKEKDTIDSIKARLNKTIMVLSMLR